MKKEEVTTDNTENNWKKKNKQTNKIELVEGKKSERFKQK